LLGCAKLGSTKRKTMKTLIVLLALFATPAFALSNVNIRDMHLSQGQKSLEVDVVYGGGCKVHAFKMEIKSCLKSMPAKCGVEVWDQTTGDNCRALISTTAKFSLEEVGLAGYADEASIETSDGVKTVKLPSSRQ
jgi:hypothetical protein